MGQGWKVLHEIPGAHPHIENYPLLPGDLLTLNEADETYWKECPGISIGGFKLTAAQEASDLEPVEYSRFGLDYQY